MRADELNLASPWVTFGKKLHALFEKDPDISVGEVYQEGDGYALDIMATEEKYDALTKLLPKNWQFGNVSLSIILHNVDEDDDDEAAFEEYRQLFRNNRILREIKVVTDPAGVKHAYVRFEPEVIQFPNDDTRDLRGLWSGLAQDIARELFETEYRGVHFGTVGMDEN